MAAVIVADSFRSGFESRPQPSLIINKQSVGLKATEINKMEMQESRTVVSEDKAQLRAGCIHQQKI